MIVGPFGLVTGKPVRPGSLDRLDQDPGAGGGDVVSAYPVCSFPVCSFSRVMAESGAIPVLKVLYVPDYCTHAERMLKTTELSQFLSRSLPGFQPRVALEEPPFEDLEGTGLHFEKQGKARLTGRKLANAVRVDLFTSVAKLLRELVTHRPAVVVGRGQGAVVVLAASKPVVVRQCFWHVFSNGMSAGTLRQHGGLLSSPLPKYPASEERSQGGRSCGRHARKCVLSTRWSPGRWRWYFRRTLRAWSS